MRVAYFTESLYPHVDGVSRTLARLFATLEARSIDFRIFSPFVPSAEQSWRPRVERVRYVRFPLYPDYRVSLPFTHGIRRSLSEYSPDLIHVVSPTPLAYRVQTIGKRHRIPVVASFHTHFVSYFRYYGIPWLESVGWDMLRRFYRGCARVYVPTKSIADELLANGIGRIELWSRGIDLQAFSPVHRDPLMFSSGSRPKEVPVILMVSRLVREKALETLIPIDRILRARGVPFQLAIVGDGPLRDELRTALPEAVFAGHLEGDDLARWYASADVFVLPSTTETLGNVVLEALASGLPAVVVDRGGPQDLIEPGRNGFVARANDPTSIADHLQRLLERPELRGALSRGARDSAKQRDWETINGALLESYGRVIAEAGGVPAASV